MHPPWEKVRYKFYMKKEYYTGPSVTGLLRTTDTSSKSEHDWVRVLSIKTTKRIRQEHLLILLNYTSRG